MIARLRQKAVHAVRDPGLRGALVSITVRIAAADGQYVDHSESMAHK